MKPSREPNCVNARFLLATSALFAVIALLDYLPALVGAIPVPADLIYVFPPWSDLRSSKPSLPRHAEIGDLITQFYPWHLFAATSLRQGQFPLLDPLILLGAPFLANPQSALFYPLNALYYVLSTPTAWTLSFPIRLVIAGVSAAAFAHTIGASRFGACVGGIAFALSGFMTVWAGQPLGDAALWLPSILLGIELLRRSVTPKRIALLGIVLALPVLAGHPEGAAFVTLTGGVFAAYRLVWPSQEVRSHSDRRRYIVAFASAGLLALTLAAVQLLPSLEWLGQVHRSLDLRWGARPPHELLTFISRDISSNPSSANIAVPEGEGYAGIVTLALAALSPLRRHRWDVVFFSALIVLSLQVVYGWGPLYALSQSAWVIRGLKNWRLLLIITFSLAMLSALGYTEVERYISLADEKFLWRRWLPPIFAFAIACSFGSWKLYHDELLSTITAPPVTQSLTASIAILLAATCAILVTLLTKPRSFYFGAAAVILMSADLLTFCYGYIPFEKSSDVFPLSPAFAFLRSHDSSEYRIASVDGTYGGNFNIPYDIEAAGGYDEPLARVANLIAPLGSYDQLSSQKLITVNDRRIDLMNIKYVLATTRNGSAAALGGDSQRFTLLWSQGSVRIYENKLVLPRVFLVPLKSAVEMSSDSAALDGLTNPDFDPVNSVLVTNNDIGSIQDIPEVDNQSVRVERIEVSSGSHYGINVNADRPSILVLSEAYYPGWHAFVDGHEVPVLQTDYAFLGAEVPAGASHVDFKFAPTSFRLGLDLSIAAFLTFVVLLAWPVYRSIRMKVADERDSSQD